MDLDCQHFQFPTAGTHLIIPRGLLCLHRFERSIAVDRMRKYSEAHIGGTQWN